MYSEPINQGTYSSLLYPFIYKETQNSKAPTSVLRFHGFGIEFFLLTFRFDLKLGNCISVRIQNRKQPFSFRLFMIYFSNSFFVTAN